MNILAAYALVELSGRVNPRKQDVTAVLSSIGIKADDTMLDYFFEKVKGKSVPELIAQGNAMQEMFTGITDVEYVPPPVHKIQRTSVAAFWLQQLVNHGDAKSELLVDFAKDNSLPVRDVYEIEDKLAKFNAPIFDVVDQAYSKVAKISV